MGLPGLAWLMQRRFFLWQGAAAAGALLLWPWSRWLARLTVPEKMIDGVVWQIDSQTLAPHGSWERLGARTLLVQWTALDGVSFIEGGGGGGSLWPQAGRLPDWQRIAREPWAQEVILGLAGHSNEAAARNDVRGLIAVSAQLARLPTPLHVTGWYFPVEIDSSWQAAPQLGPLLADLPRPLWLSLYDRANVGAQPLAEWLAQWLPADVGIFFQDGVGVHARTPVVAREHAEVLIRQFGRERVRLIAEAFRPLEGGGFRSATAGELRAQLQVYAGLPVYLFDGPHYVSDGVVNALAPQGERAAPAN